MIEPKVPRAAALRKPPQFSPLFLPLLFLLVIPGGNLLLELPCYPAPTARHYPSPGHRPGVMSSKREPRAESPLHRYAAGSLDVAAFFVTSASSNNKQAPTTIAESATLKSGQW